MRRFSSDDEPPSLFWCSQRDEMIIVSEPLDGESHGWNGVAPGHMLVGEAGGQIVARKMQLG